MRALTTADVDRVIGVLARRRARLEPRAPVLWRPAPGATARHRDFLTWLLTDGGGVGVRRGDDLVVAAPGHDGTWVVDDAHCRAGTWTTVGRELWLGLRERLAPAPVRLVVPTPEAERAAFADSVGLQLATSWWHLEVPLRSDGLPYPASDLTVDGVTTLVVEAPPVYDPGGPVLFVRDPGDGEVLGRVVGAAQSRSCSLVVVEQSPERRDLAAELSGRGYRRHCDFYDGHL